MQEEEFERRLRKGRRTGERITRPLYDVQDVLHLLRYFRQQPDQQRLQLGADIEVIFPPVRHILGSAAIEIREKGSAVLFSGDLGNPQRNVVPDPAPAPVVDLLFCESTYGDRLHRSEAGAWCANCARRSTGPIRRAATWLIPSFALERTQDILFQLRQLRQRGEVPETPVYVDSPLAINITRVDQTPYGGSRRRDARGVQRARGPVQLSRPHHLQQRRAVARGEWAKRGDYHPRQRHVPGGRVVHHLKHNLWRADTAALFVGYQAVGTLGRRLVDGVAQVTIEHEPIAVQARIFTINGFSAHADQAALTGWLATSDPAHIVLNHGETSATTALARLLTAQGRHVEVAHPQAVYDTAHLPVAALP